MEEYFFLSKQFLIDSWQLIIDYLIIDRISKTPEWRSFLTNSWTCSNWWMKCLIFTSMSIGTRQSEWDSISHIWPNCQVNIAHNLFFFLLRNRSITKNARLPLTDKRRLSRYLKFVQRNRFTLTLAPSPAIISCHIISSGGGRLQWIQFYGSRLINTTPNDYTIDPYSVLEIYHCEYSRSLQAVVCLSCIRSNTNTSIQIRLYFLGEHECANVFVSAVIQGACLQKWYDSIFAFVEKKKIEPLNHSTTSQTLERLVSEWFVPEVTAVERMAVSAKKKSHYRNNNDSYRNRNLIIFWID